MRFSRFSESRRGRDHQRVSFLYAVWILWRNPGKMDLFIPLQKMIQWCHVESHPIYPPPPPPLFYLDDKSFVNNEIIGLNLQQYLVFTKTLYAYWLIRPYSRQWLRHLYITHFYHRFFKTGLLYITFNIWKPRSCSYHTQRRGYNLTLDVIGIIVFCRPH